MSASSRLERSRLRFSPNVRPARATAASSPSVARIPATGSSPTNQPQISSPSAASRAGITTAAVSPALCLTAVLGCHAATASVSPLAAHSVSVSRPATYVSELAVYA